MDNLHQYLCKSFKSAICKLNPGINVNSLNVRFYLTSNNTFDICTPIAKQLCSKQISLPVNSLAERLYKSIEWDTFFIQSASLENITDGFINLSISLHYLYNLLVNNPPIDKNTDLNHQICANNTYNKIRKVVDHAISHHQISRHIDFQTFSSLLNEKERSLLVLLAYLKFPETLSGKLFTVKKIISVLEEYYSTTPIITRDEYLNTVRIYLLQKAVAEIADHLY